MNYRLTHEDHSDWAGYSSILRRDSLWETGAINLTDGSSWTYAEPGAKVSVKRGDLRLKVVPFTRQHNAIQTLDNAKHLYFSKVTYPTAAVEPTEYEVSMSAKGVGTLKGDIFDGFVTFHLLDAESGVAADFFASDDNVAIAYSRPKRSGQTERTSRSRDYLATFKEVEIHTSPGEIHQYKIVYDRAQARLSWIADGNIVAEERDVPSDVSRFRLGLGVMTAKNITEGKSISVHGQGMMGHWSPVRVGKAN